MLGILALAATGLIVVAIGLAHKPDFTKVAAALGWPVSYVDNAYRWAKHYGVPFEWVLTTISVESGGKPNVTGDEGGRSVGLMQVNTVAHAKDMAAAGVSREQMFLPSVNIQWGTRLMKEFYDNVRAALGSRTPPAPLDVILRLAYKGPKTVYASLRAGKNPLDLSWAPEAANRWRRHMQIVQAAVHGRSLTRSQQTV